jgi:hypothetical protein
MSEQDTTEKEKEKEKDVFDNSTLSNAFNSIFTQSNIIFLLWFLAIYFVLYFVLGLFFKSETGSLVGSYIFDLLMFGLLVAILLGWYYSSTGEERKNTIVSILNYLKDYINETMSIFSTAIFIVVLYSVAYLLRVPMETNRPLMFSIVENIAWFIFVVTIFVQFFKYVFGISILDYISKMWGEIPKDEEDDEKKEENANKDEVFNISNNLYTYDDAQAICTSYGGRLATYNEMEEAYNKGAEWCNYGWSADQMAFFPTQKSTWDKLQKTKNHKNDCGRPGVNGGYMANPYIRFGVNCYGKKPAASDADKNRMNANKNRVYPKTNEDALLDAKVQFWKNNSDKLLKINSFNNDKWSEF